MYLEKKYVTFHVIPVTFKDIFQLLGADQHPVTKQSHGFWLKK
jgi:hypothetical protein